MTPQRTVDRVAPSKSKLAEATARRMEQMIIRRGWPVGEVLGSEEELVATLGVSRAVFREAVRIMEHDRIVSMKAGPHGGLVVKAADATVPVRQMATEQDLERLSSYLRDEQRGAELHGGGHTSNFHHLLGEMTHSPVVEMFVRCLVELKEQGVVHAQRPSPTLMTVIEHHRTIGEMIARRESALATNLLQEHLAMVGRALEESKKLDASRVWAT